MKKINRIKFILIEAFTLAEIMIVLSVIGVLTAVLLPSARQMTPDEIMMRFKKINSDLAIALRELINSNEYFLRGDLGTTENGDLVTDPKYFCNALADVLSVKKVNCSDNGSTTIDVGAFGNLSDISTLNVNGTTNTIQDYADCICASNTGAGEEIVLNDGTVIYTVNPKYHFGTTIPDATDNTVQRRVFNVCSEQKRYKYICVDVDGINKGEAPFGYALRVDGKLLYGSRAQAWANGNIQGDSAPSVTTISSCTTAASSITGENDVCVANTEPVYSGGGDGGDGGGGADSGPSEEEILEKPLHQLFDIGCSMTKDATNNRKYIITGSGSFKPLYNMEITLFLVGGAGGRADKKNASASGNACAGGTNTTTFFLKKDAEYKVTVGAGKGSTSCTCWQSGCCCAGASGDPSIFYNDSGAAISTAAGGKGQDAGSCTTPSEGVVFDGVTYAVKGGGSKSYASGNSNCQNGTIILLIDKLPGE